ncbi:PREDICTED: otogelin-like protein [Propithecus coquereli]|uniref:otogelin-like protein n=1 Tax=Propithecus coquereli TaxID=379532 RepID=UPI00063FB030|nr:PREDICTED: otogelin-like protein [Propithecus coquereli]
MASADRLGSAPRDVPSGGWEPGAESARGHCSLAAAVSGLVSAGLSSCSGATSSPRGRGKLTAPPTPVAGLQASRDLSPSSSPPQRLPVVSPFEATSPRYFFHEAINWGESKIKGSCPYECLNGAFCSKAGICDCQIFQALGTRCQIVPNMGNGRDGICKTWGQYHFETFDGIYYYFPGNCSYIFAKDCGTLEPRYTVWVHNSPKCLGSVYSCYRSISLFFSNQEEIRIYGHEIKKNGISLTLPQTIGQVFIEKLADYILVKTTFGFSLAWDGISGIYLKLSEDHKGKPCGLCGNYNGIQSDDFIIQQADKCDDSFVHRDCISCCPPTCTFEKQCLGSNLHCLDGCYCPDGLIMENGTCISLENCPCSFHGLAYSVGSKIEQECTECVCVGGVWNCTEHDCPVQCSVVGDSHFTTFDGRHYSFIGMCQYILVKGTGKNKFTITLQKAPCEQNLGLVCLQSITLILEDDFNKQVTLSRGGQILTSPNQGFNLNGIVEIHTLSSLFILLKTTFGLRILFAVDGERIYIQLTSAWKRRTLGLCGTFNGNIRDDFLSPSGMIEGTPQLHANAWRVSTTCFAPVHVPMVDPCNINQQNIGYAAHCDFIHQELFAPCHVYISPGLYYQLCRHDACKCGSACLCNALAHYAYLCGQRGVPIHFRDQISFCAVVCQKGMLYHHCSSFCRRSCISLSSPELCNDDCAEGCNCPEGKFYEDTLNFCVPIFHCRCHYRGSVYQPGELIPTPSGLCQCSNGTVKCDELATPSTVHVCPEGKEYFDCRFPNPELPAGGINCETTCANLAMNFTCAPSSPCISGCVCAPGKGIGGREKKVTKEQVPMQGKIKPGRNQVLEQSTDDSDISVIAQNKKCFDNDIVCSKSVLISVGDTEIYLNDAPYKQKLSGFFLESKHTYQLWKAGYYIVVYFPEKDITILWDKKTTIHIKVGPQWKIDVTSFAKNCHEDTCNCNLGGDCECLCTSIAAYAYKCCQEGLSIHWRSSTVCSLALVSLESAERPNYFLYVHDDDTLSLKLWEANSAFHRRATFFHHQGLWIPGYSAFELYSKKGFFITVTDSSVKVSKYDDSEEFKHSSSFSIEEIQVAVPYRRMCEWRYEPCATPCFKTCSDPEALACTFLPPGYGLYSMTLKVMGIASSFLTGPEMITPSEITVFDMLTPTTGLECEVEVDSIVVPLPFSNQELSIEDSGAMYVITTPAGLIIKWAHLTGIIDIHFGFQFNLSSYTEGLCGICNEDPDDDLRMQNGTIITNMEDIELFIESWEIEKSFEVTMRRPVRNCTEHDCSQCIDLLNRRVFIPCHDKVTLSCPEGKEYQPCVRPCEARTCLNKWFYGHSLCLNLREDCVCKDGTILHRPYSTQCIPEKECECDPLKCPNISTPECREDQFMIQVQQEEPCCFSPVCICESCTEPIPLCTNGEFLTVDLNTTHFCCPQYYCVCEPNLCPMPLLTCAEDMNLVKENVSGHCCPTWRCECNCENLVMPTCEVSCSAINTIACTDSEEQPRTAGEIWNGCIDECALYKCLENGSIIPIEPDCDEEPSPICEREAEVVIGITDKWTCCSKEVCGCDMTLCETTMPTCTNSEKFIVGYSSLSCCPQYKCVLEKDDVCVFQEVSVLNPGQSMIKYLEGDFCYTIECLEEKDNHTGFHTLNFTMVKCSKECDVHQVYTPSSSDYDCCGTCKNVSCKFHMENGTSVIHECGKREERICQKVIIKSIIRKQDCVSQSPINVASCDGKCPSATIYNINIESHLRFCKCCRENGVRNLTVPLYCSGNGTEIMYTLQEPVDCTCQWS